MALWRRAAGETDLTSRRSHSLSATKKEEKKEKKITVGNGDLPLHFKESVEKC